MSARLYGATAVAVLIAALYAYNRFYLPEQMVARQACRAVKLMMANEPLGRTIEDAGKIGSALVACRDAGHLAPLPRLRSGSPADPPS